MKGKILLITITVLIFASCNTSNSGVKFEKDGSFYFYAFVNDSIKGRFIFDTGADGLYLDSTFVKRHNSVIKSELDTASMRGAGATGYKQIFLIKDTVKVDVDNYTYNFTNSPILKLTDINGENIAGIIGNDFIKNQILTIDNERLTLSIDTIVKRENYESILPFEYTDGRIYLYVDLKTTENKTIKAKLLMDLGCSDAIILNSPYFKTISNNFLPKQIVDYTILYGGALGGNSNGGEFRAISVKLGDDIINNPIVSFSKDTLGAFSKTDYDGLLGNEILDRYNYAIDYRNQKLYLIKNAQSKRSFKSTLTGFYAMKTKDYATVMSIYYQSEAYKNGLQLGDTIVAINDKKVNDLTDKQFYNEQKDKGKKIKLTVLRKNKQSDISFVLKHLL